MIVNFGGRTHLFNFTMIHHDNRISYLHCFLLIVGNKNTGNVNFFV